MQDIDCAICGTKTKKKLLYKANFKQKDINSKTFSARRQADNVHYQINRCEKCELIFSSPIFPPTEIESLYKESYFNYECQAQYLKDTYFEYLEGKLKRFDTREKLLDVGAGNGFFLEKLWEKGYKNVYGLEPSKDAISKAANYLRHRIKPSILREGIFENNNFGLIACFHTLDHVVNPNKFIKTCYRLLKKDGFAYFVVHDTGGLSVKLLGEKSPIFDIEHIYLFDKNTLEKIFLKNGFRNIEVFEIKNKYPLNYWSGALPLPQLIRKFILVLLKISRLGSVPIKIGAGNIGIFAFK